jgi:chemotaxis protein methyltransferase CheR
VERTVSNHAAADDLAAAEQAMVLVQRHLGFRIERTSRSRLLRAVREGAQERRLDPARFAAEMARDPDALQSFVDRITVQETSFFRHPEQFVAVAGHVLPTLPRPVIVWSAGCANGQEAYSLAMLLEEAGVDGTIIATDVSDTALARTMAGRYTEREVQGLSMERRSRHLVRSGPSWRVGDGLRRRVRVLPHNLLDPPPYEVRSCHLVFCRNVLIYLTPEHAAAVLCGFADHLPTDLTLFVGGAETLWQLTSRFAATRIGGVYAHRPAPAAASLANAPTLAPPASARARPAQPAEASTVDLRVLPVCARLTATGRPSFAPIPARGRSGGEERSVPPERSRSKRRGEAGEQTVSRRAPISVRQAPAPPGDSAVLRDDVDARILELVQAGEGAFAQGDVLGSVAAFRKWVYLAPDDPAAHLHLALALNASGDSMSAARATRAAVGALRRGDPAVADSALGGYSADEVLRLMSFTEGANR